MPGQLSADIIRAIQPGGNEISNPELVN